MAWTYDGTPNTTTPEGRRDFVRLNVGDTDTNDQLVTDEAIAAALLQVRDDVYLASAIIARALAAKFARQQDISMGEGALAITDSKISDAYFRLAERMEKQARKYSQNSIGVPAAGGLTKTEIDTLKDDPDWNAPRFAEGQFEDPGSLDGRINEKD
jgi:hypothetical protein